MKTAEQIAPLISSEDTTKFLTPANIDDEDRSKVCILASDWICREEMGSLVADKTLGLELLLVLGLLGTENSSAERFGLSMKICFIETGDALCLPTRQSRSS